MLASLILQSEPGLVSGARRARVFPELLSQKRRGHLSVGLPCAHPHSSPPIRTALRSGSLARGQAPRASLRWLPRRPLLRRPGREPVLPPPPPSQQVLEAAGSHRGVNRPWGTEAGAGAGTGKQTPQVASPRIWEGSDTHCLVHSGSSVQNKE